MSSLLKCNSYGRSSIDSIIEVVDGQRMRLFVGVWPPAGLVSSLEERMERWRREISDGVSWVRPQKLHVTLAFLGAVPSERLNSLHEALQLASSSDAIQLQVGGLGCFPNVRRPKVLWAGLKGELEALATLQSAVFEACGTFFQKREERGFSPHLTLARLKEPSGSAVRALRQLLESSSGEMYGTWRVERYDLIQSVLGRQGGYRTLQSYPLEKAA